MNRVPVGQPSRFALGELVVIINRAIPQSGDKCPSIQIKSNQITRMLRSFVTAGNAPQACQSKLVFVSIVLLPPPSRQKKPLCIPPPSTIQLRTLVHTMQHQHPATCGLRTDAHESGSEWPAMQHHRNWSTHSLSRVQGQAAALTPSPSCWPSPPGPR